MIARLSSYTSGWRWVPTSESELGQSETKIFSYLRRKFQCYAVDVSGEEEKKENANKRRCCRPEERKIWTIEMEDPKTDRAPIVYVCRRAMKPVQNCFDQNVSIRTNLEVTDLFSDHHSYHYQVATRFCSEHRLLGFEPGLTIDVP